MERDNESVTKRKDRRRYAWEAVILTATAAAAGCAGYCYTGQLYETVRLVIFSIIGSGCVIFAMEASLCEKSFLFDNEEHLERFALLYLIFLVMGALFPMLPVGGWPYLVVFIGLMLFSNQLVALSAGSSLLLMTVLLTDSAGAEDFLLYFVSGMTGILVFSRLKEAFLIGQPLLVSLMVQMVCLSVREILLVNETLGPGLFLIPALSSVICLILLLILLKFFSFSIVYKNKDSYLDINDPECPLLVELKNYSKDEYHHAVHTAYLCDRIAKRLSLDDGAAKAGGYYHRAGLLKGEINWENTEQILEEYHFPEAARRVLKEYLSRNEKIVSRETAVLLISDTLISSIEYLFSRDHAASPDYEKLIGAVYRKKVESGLLKDSLITMKELTEIREILLEERLYYDFLR